MTPPAWFALASSSALVVLAASCSSPSGTGPAPVDASIAVDAPPVMPPCPDATVCLKPFLVTDKPVTAGRLTVVWFQLMRVNGLPPMPVEVGYDVPFVPGKPRYDIPLAQIRPPSRHQLLLCQWNNGVCNPDAPIPGIGFALPVILDDTSGNGAIDTTEITLYGNHGIGMAYFGWSKNAHATGSRALSYDDGDPTYLGDIFTGAIAAGVHGYALLPGPGFDQRLGAPDSASGSDLAICPTQGTSCQVTAPRLAGSQNP